MWVLVQDPLTLDQQRLNWRTTLLEHPQVARLYVIVQRFIAMIHTHQALALDPWLADAFSSDIPQLQHFAHRLYADYDGVYAALTLPWSAGQTEGQINRLKLINRQMYGRAKFDLLRL